MEQKVQATEQDYWRLPALPFVELRRTLNSEHAYKAHSHPQLTIGAVLQGRVTVNILGDTFTAEAGELVFFAPDQVHSCNPSLGETRSYYMLFLDKTWCLQQLSALYQRSISRFYCQPCALLRPELFKAFTQLAQALFDQHTAKTRRGLKQLILPILAGYCIPRTEAPSEHPVTQQIRQCLLQDLSAPPTLKMLAKRLGYRPETLIRLFKRDTGLSPKAFANNLRIEYAKQQLRGGAKIVDTAIDTGFSDQSHFHKTFVHYTAATPRQYQASTSILHKKTD